MSAVTIPSGSLRTASPSGFGDYALPPGKTFAQMQLCAKVQQIFLVILYSALAILSLALLSSALSIALVGTAAFSYLAAKAILSVIGIAHQAPPMQDLFPQEVQAALPALGKFCNKPYSGFATRDGIESHRWKLHLIRAAKHTIFISGCYCGGMAFDETLCLIRERMRRVATLKVSILSSDIFITKENKALIQELTKEFQERFSCVVSRELFPYVSPTTGRFSLTTNHTKALIIDYGAAFMIGGSGIVSAWSGQKGCKAAEQIERHGTFYDWVLQIKAYRDMDFGFQGPIGGIGTRLYVEMEKLLERFRYRKSPSPPFSARSHSWQVPREPLALPQQIGNLKIACYATGPENGSNAFYEELRAQVKQAKISIVIAHMYLHLGKDLLQDLRNAARRGVPITIITNKLGSKSPGSHLGYAELSRYYAKALFEGKENPRIAFYEYDVPYTTFHKKVILIDGKTSLIGSGNLGKKSLDGSDYEINLKVESEEFAASIAEIIEEDKQLCQRDKNPDISLKTRICSSLQSLLCSPVL